MALGYQFINSDNKAAMTGFATGCFHLAILDPPYGIGEAGKNSKSRNTLVRQADGKTMRRTPSNKYVKSDWDDMPPDFSYFKEVYRVSKNQIIFGANYFYEVVGMPFKTPRRHQYDQFIKDHPVGWIIWDKVNGGNDFNDSELIYTSFDRPTFVLYFMWNGMMQGKSIEQGTTMQGNKNLNEKRIHCTQKPVKLYYWLIENYSDKDQNIIDPNIGSFSSAIAAYLYGVKSV